MDATDLARWTRFAAKGGIGKCTALQDCVAEHLEDLMFLKDDEIIVLLQLTEESEYLGFCEGVVGRFNASAVQFHGKLKRPVFAKRQSGAAASSSSRPVSLSSRSPQSDAQSPTIGVSRQVSSPSPLGFSLSPTVRSDSRNGAPFSNHSTPFTIAHPHATDHTRIPSSSSSVSHYSNQSHNRKLSQPIAHDASSPLTAIPPHVLHGRTVSATSSHSAYSSHAPSRTSSRAEPYPATGSEETFTDHVAALSPILNSLGPQQLPPLSLSGSDGPSSPSSFLPSPPPTTVSSFPQTALKKTVSPLFISRNRAASEKLIPQTEPSETINRAASSSYAQQASNVWINNDDFDQMKRQEHYEPLSQDPMLMIDALETSLASVYSEPSAEIHRNDLSPPPKRQSQFQIGSSVLVEDSDYDVVAPKVLTTSPDNLSDPGYDIGMQLLKEDTDSEDGQEEEESFSNAVSTDVADVPIQGTAMQQTLIRILNADDDSSSDEDVLEEEDSVANTTATQSTSLAIPHSPNGSLKSGMVLDKYVFPRPPTTTQDDIRRSRASSIVRTEDENWESDADIYDDYRYSRYSTYSSSPAQYNSKRTSRASTKSGWSSSKASERPPMPDEESWKKALLGTEADEDSLFSKYLSDRGASASASASGSQRAASPVLPSAKDIPASLVLVSSSPDAEKEKKKRTPSPFQVLSIAGSTANTQSVISPLTRAFRKSMESRYSDGESGDDERDDRRDTLTRTNLTSQLAGVGAASLSRSKSKSEDPESASSSPREKIESKRQSRSPTSENSTRVTPPTFRIDVTAHRDGAANTSGERSQTSIELAQQPQPPSPNAESHLRVDTPNSHSSSAPPSPLQPGFPPSPSAMTFQTSGSFHTSKPLTSSNIPTSLIPTSLIPATASSPTSSARSPITPPAIPFKSTLPPGLPPAHMQQFQQGGQLPPQFQQPYRHGIDSIPSVMHMAIQQRAPTIQGHTLTDLASSTGPVLISFILPGMQPPSLMPALPRPQPATQYGPFGVPVVQDQRSLTPQNPNTAGGVLPNQVSNTTSPALLPLSSQQAFHGPGQQNQQQPVHNQQAIATRSNSAQSQFGSGSTRPEERDASNAASQPLPRANFFPKVGQPRPRSRSFSDFTSEITDRIARSLDKPRSQDEVNVVTGNAIDGMFRSNSPSIFGTIRGKPRPTHGPSPLSLPPTTNVVVQSAPNSPTPLQLSSNPLSQIHPFGNKLPPSSSSSSPPFDAQEPQSKRNNNTSNSTQRQSPLGGTRGPQSPVAVSPSSISFPIQRGDSNVQRHQRVSEHLSEEDSSSPGPASSLRPPILRHSNESERTGSGSDAMSPLSLTNHSPVSSLNRHISLRPKISIPTLRSGKSRHESNSSPMTPNAGVEEDTVQIKDTEFELVKPMPTLASSEFHYADESASSKDALSLVTDMRSDSNGERHLGPSTPSSDRAGGMTSSASLDSATKRSKGHDPNLVVQAHRDRELKWISLINSTDPAQARKNKKVKKLLLEGVPSSVRYLVWAHVINSGSKKIANVYGRLSKRRPPFASEIERDVRELYPDNPQLSDPKGSLVSVLFAFIAMVPDLKYHRGLTIIAGHLLLQSPEEDAFWTFLAMMDVYLRPYFMPTSSFMNVDTTLFVKAVEAMDSVLATRLFAELNVRPLELCGVWFSSMFAGSLPLPHLHRVWDLFFYEGIPFLFRVGLAILSSSRRHFMESNPSNEVPPLQYLLRPPPEILPSDPDQFIALAYSMKLKDDDIRKSRVKMEALAKQQQRSKIASSNHTPVHPHLHGR